MVERRHLQLGKETLSFNFGTRQKAVTVKVIRED
jgi:hypothetical protein